MDWSQTSTKTPPKIFYGGCKKVVFGMEELLDGILGFALPMTMLLPALDLDGQCNAMTCTKWNMVVETS
jgi:hypothetical protein